MLRLRYLIDNPNLAQMLLDNWHYDPSDDRPFRYVRTSANAVCTFQCNHETCFLRYCPSEEKSLESVTAELEFIRYLRASGYNAPSIVPSTSGHDALCKETPWGSYVVSAFRAMPGRAVSERGPLSDQMVWSYGQSLGTLHRLSSQYSIPKVRRRNHQEVLNWIEQTLQAIWGQERALAEVSQLRSSFAGLPMTEEVYGLVHYDFETDNVFYDEASGSLGVIDFDDAMYHWYMMDTEQTLDSVAGQVAEREVGNWQERFLEGYRTEFSVGEEWLQKRPVFRRFADLYTYTRVLRSIQERWDNEPTWMQGLRRNLDTVLEQRSSRFGTLIT